MKTVRFLPLLAVGLVALLSGCTRFQTDWNHAIAAGPSPNGMEGPWQGTWRSEVNGHNDQLHCVVTKVSDGNYRARFHAKYRKVFTFGYTVPLTVTATNDSFRFNGKANLGWLAGGVYTYEGTASATNWNSTYSCKYDHGVFEMTRPR